jgi:BirA family biotin operon repressor/biotin-[acetyl-CoA-carboxylase] ligase
MSILLKPSIPASTAPMVTLVMALAVYEAALELPQDPEGSCSFGIKWPNDIVASRQGGPWKKVCGILTEMRMEEMEIKDIVIGTGLNVNQKDFPGEIADTASSFALETGMEIGRAAFTASVWKHFEEEYGKFIKAGSLSPLRALYEEGLVNRGRFVKVLDPREPFTGTARGITDTGDLIVTAEDGGDDRIVSSGEVSVRGVNGYV